MVSDMKNTPTLTLSQILYRLNRGTGARHLPGAKFLGHGAQRTAYRVGKYVVKKNVVAWDASSEFNWSSDKVVRDLPKRISCRVPRKALASVGLAAPATWYAGRNRKYVVQKYYAPVRKPGQYTLLYSNDALKAFDCGDIEMPRHHIASDVYADLDLHCGNIGIRADGALVAFDW